MRRYFLLLLMMCLFQQVLFGQNQHKVDSLLSALKKHDAAKKELGSKVPAMYDTTAANILNKLSADYRVNKPKIALDYANQSLAMSEQIGFKKGISNAYNSKGTITLDKGDYLLALECHKKALKIRREIGDKKGIAGSYNNIGIVYRNLGNLPDALKYLFAALKIKEELGNKKDIATSFINIGVIYVDLKNYPEALKIFFDALKIYKTLPGNNSIALCYGNIGNIYDLQGNFTEGLNYHLMALKIFEKTGNKDYIAFEQIKIGNNYMARAKMDEALKNYLTSIKIYEELNSKSGLADAYVALGDFYIKLKNSTEAANYLEKGLIFSKEIGSIIGIKSCYESLVKLDSIRGDFKQCFEHQKLFIFYRDSFMNNEHTKKITQQQMQYEFDKKESQSKAIHEKKDALAKAEIAKQKLIRNWIIGGFGLVALLLFFVYQNFNKQKIANKKLKETQAQLIASEKMAAFGIMASRVAHEIQNPLNFVNNFSDISEELVEDILSAKNDEDRKEAGEILTENLKKINHHGKRAEAIVTELQKHIDAGTAQEFFEENKI
ncbi:MAG: tetratricopeptide repeat protein [Bacteroidetes bacterium]|nr:tetratricopeptide repeat protein [Bacteroidota bacterium]